MHNQRETTIPAVTTGYEGAKQRTGLGQATLENLVRNGTLRSAKVGKRRLIFVASLDELLTRSSEHAA